MTDAISASAMNQMVADLNKSVQKAVERVQAQQAADTAKPAQEFRKDVRKSSMNTAMFATDIGVLAKETTRLNVISTLAPKDTADFYKFRVTSKGEATIGQIGDDGVRVQLMNRFGVVMADSNKDASKHEEFKKFQKGELTLDRGDYTLRITREKDVKDSEAKNYAVQLRMGGYTKDFDTVAKQPRKGDSPFQLTQAQQAMLTGLNSALGNLRSIPSGLSGTQKLMGSFSLFV